MGKIKTICAIALLSLSLISIVTGCDGGTTYSSETSYKTETTKTEDRHSNYKHGDKKKTCIACNGSGRIKQYYTNDPNEEGHWEECVVCGGEGWYYE